MKSNDRYCLGYLRSHKRIATVTLAAALALTGATSAAYISYAQAAEDIVVSTDNGDAFNESRILRSTESRAAQEGGPRYTSALAPIHSKNIVVRDAQGQEHIIDGSGTAIGIVGDGIEVDHPGFSNPPKNPKIKRDGGKKVILGSRYNPDAIHSEKAYHDLFSAGVAAANGMTSTEADAKPIQGVAPEAQIVFEQITGEESEDQEARALLDAVYAGADVVNLSFGIASSTTNLSKAFADAIQTAQDAGVVVVTSMGNDGYVGFEGTKPQSTNPDYGLVSRPGITSQGIGSASCNAPVIHSQGFTLKGSNTDTEYWMQMYWSDDFKVYDGKDYEYVVLDNPKATDFMGENAARLAGKFVLMPAVVPGLSNSTNNPDGLWPDYIILSHMAKEAGATGTIFYDNSKPYKLNRPLWPVIWEDHYDTTLKKWVYDWDEYETFKTYPVLGVSINSAQRMKNAAQKEFTYHSEMRDDVQYDRGMQMAGDSSWGVSSDFVFKSDMTAPAGKSLTSLTNPYNKRQKKRILTVGQNSGTSFASPQIAAGIAMVKQRLNIQYPDIVQKDGRTARLMKNLLMGTCVPLSDTNEAGQDVLRSPRSQGNGLMQIREACMSDCVAISPRTEDPETGYTKTNLRSFDGRVIEFDIELNNIGLTEHSFTPHLNVIADEVVDGRYTMQSTYLAKDLKLDPVTIPAREASSVEPGKTTMHVRYEIPEDVFAKLQEASPNGFFVDGFVTFTSNDEIPAPTLSHAFTGFAGDWFKPPIYDPFVYDLKPGQNNFYNSFTPDMMEVNKRTGDLNSTHLETMVEKQRRILGALPNHEVNSISASDKILAISPNNDNRADYVDPVLTILRNYKDIQVSVKNSEGTEVFRGAYGVGVGDIHKNSYSNNTDKADTLVTQQPKLLSWDARDVDSDKFLPEGIYDYKISVIPDYVNATNKYSIDNLTKGNPDKAYVPVVRDFTIKVDVTAPVLMQTEIVKEEPNPDDPQDPILHLKLEAEDPKLSNTEDAGSGIYAAELMLDGKTQALPIDPLNQDSLAQQDITVKKSQFKNLKLKLTDSAFNSSTHTPALKLKGMKMGHLNIASQDEDGQPLTVRYMLEDVQTGDIYNSYEDLPVGYYAIHPYNAPEGYVLKSYPKGTPEAKQQGTFVSITEDATESRTFTYDYVLGSVDFEAEAMSNEAKNIVTSKSVQLMLTDKDTGMSYVFDANADGVFEGKIVPGVYTQRFIGATSEDALKLWNDKNFAPRDISIYVGPHLFFFHYGAQDDKPQEDVITDGRISTYIAHQSFMHIHATKDSKLEIALYPSDEENQVFTKDNASRVLTEANGDFKVYEVPGRDGGLESDYYLDLSPEAIKTLTTPHFIRAFITAPDAQEETPSSKMAVVGFNHPLVLQQRAYLLKQAKQKFDAGTLTEENYKKIEDLADQVARLRNYLNMQYDSFVDLNPNPSSGSSAKPSINDIVDGIPNHLYLFDIAKKLDTMAELMDMKVDDIPVVTAHLGYFPQMRTLLYPNVHDEDYTFVETPTTAIVPDLDVIKEARDFEMARAFYMEDGEKHLITHDRAGNVLQPELSLKVSMLRGLKAHYDVSGWRQEDGASASSILNNENAIDPMVVNDLTSSFAIKPTMMLNHNIVLMARSAQNSETPVIHAGIKLMDAAGKNEIDEVTSDSLGMFTLLHVAPGNYLLVNTDDEPAGYRTETFSKKLTINEDGSYAIDGTQHTADNPFILTYRLPAVDAAVQTDDTSAETSDAQVGTDAPDTADAGVGTETPATTDTGTDPVENQEAGSQIGSVTSDKATQTEAASETKDKVAASDALKPRPSTAPKAAQSRKAVPGTGDIGSAAGIVAAAGVILAGVGHIWKNRGHKRR